MLLHIQSKQSPTLDTCVVHRAEPETLAVDMYLATKRTIAGKPVFVIIRTATHERLAGTCFRGKGKALAGNFLHWNFPDECLRHDSERALNQLIDEASEKHNRGWSSLRITVEFNEVIGWSSTDDLNKYDQNDLEGFSPNRKSKGLRVKAKSSHLLAPATKLCTMVCELKDEGDGFAIIIHTMYPGKDIGNLSGKITKNRKVIFFTWERVGEPITQDHI